MRQISKLIIQVYLPILNLDGSWVETETTIPASELPAAVTML